MASAGEKFSSYGSPAKTGGRSLKQRWSVGPAVIGVGIAASIWVVAALAVVQTMGSSMQPENGKRFQASLGLNAVKHMASQDMRTVHVAKFSRLTVLPRINLAAATVPHRTVVAVAKTKPAAEFIEKTQVIALAAAAKLRGDNVVTGSTPVVANALVDASPMQAQGTTKPFNLVMQEPASSLDGTLPNLGPLPLAKPKTLADMFAKDKDDTRAKPAAKELAYAKPDEPMDDDNEVRPTFTAKRGTAYYDISAGVVHMPDGSTLEAHSGIGKMRDNPDYVHVKMKGPTPPGTYKVTMREALFHGVEAVRLTPTDGVAPHGRVGLLAHSYLLRTRGDSHGCVAFADYPKFLKAFKRGEISTMVIVTSMRGISTPGPKRTLASLFSRKG